jgi:hypothetical protein
MRILLTSLLSLVLGCGADSNILGLTVPDEHKDSFEYILTEARVAYDHGRLDEALELSTKAFQMVPDSERAALLYGFVNLSLAGGDPFKIARTLAEDAANKKSGKDAGTATATATSSSIGTSTSTSTAASDSSSDALGPLRAIIGLRDDEVAAIGTLDASDVELPIYIPSCVEDARSTLEKLQFVNNAIYAVCRFVDVEARIEGDYRQQCEQFAGARRQGARAHFLWAFAHLTEALAFQSVLMFGSPDGKAGTSNLEKRVEKIKAQSASGTAGIQTFLASLTTLQRTLAAVMPTSGRCSETAPTTQIRATLNDLLAVESALSRLPGLSPDIGNSLKKALGRFKNVQGGLDPGQAKSEQTKVLRQDLTKNMSKSLGEKIDGLAAENGGVLPAEQKETVCGAYSQVAAGAPLPPSCDPDAATPIDPSTLPPGTEIPPAAEQQLHSPPDETQRE